MSKESEFFIYLLERYAAYKNCTADQILKTLNDLNLTTLVYDLYEIYHSERLENAYSDIDQLIREASSQKD